MHFGTLFCGHVLVLFSAGFIATSPFYFFSAYFDIKHMQVLNVEALYSTQVNCFVGMQKLIVPFVNPESHSRFLAYLLLIK